MTTSAPSSQTITVESMRHVLAGFATGIVIVAAQVDGRVVGLSANSFTSVSLDPPLVSISFAHTSTSWPLLRTAPRWGVSVLGQQQAHVLQELRLPSSERFNALDMQVVDGAAFLLDALAHLSVSLEDEIVAGDHTLTLLRVLDLQREANQRPLVFFNSETHHLAS